MPLFLRGKLMKTKSPGWLVILALLALDFPSSTARAQGTAFNYNGSLASGGVPANGSYDLTFALFNVSSNGVAVAGPVTNSATAVNNGLFGVTLDFGGGVFNGANYWLEIGVRTNGGGTFATLTPRQPVLPTPYAIMANTASNLLGTLPAAQLSGAIANGNLPFSPNFSGAVAASSFTGNGGGLTNLNPSAISPGGVQSSLYFTNPFNFFSGAFNGFYTGNGSGLTNLNPSAISPGGVQSSLYFTNPFNFFSGGFNGFYTGNGSGLTNLNPSAISPGGVQSSLYFTNPFNFFSGGFNGFYTGNGSGLTNLNPSAISPGGVQSSLYFTNPFNFFNGGFNGFYSGDGSGLTNVNANAIVNGLTTNLVVTVPTGTATLVFSNGILRAVR
jgi:hypothetical protein